jgi:hypothetical protein
VSSDPGSGSAAVVLRGPDRAHSIDDVRLQRLWLAARRREWQSLAVVAVSKSADSLPVANLLANLAWSYRGQPSCVFDLRDLSLRLVDYHMHEMRTAAEAGNIVVIALRSIFENPTAAPMARGADATVLCIDLGSAQLKAAEKTIAEIGRERVLGAIVVHPPPPTPREGR